MPGPRALVPGVLLSFEGRFGGSLSPPRGAGPETLAGGTRAAEKGMATQQRSSALLAWHRRSPGLSWDATDVDVEKEPPMFPMSYPHARTETELLITQAVRGSKQTTFALEKYRNLCHFLPLGFHTKPRSWGVSLARTGRSHPGRSYPRMHGAWVKVIPGDKMCSTKRTSLLG